MVVLLGGGGGSDFGWSWNWGPNPEVFGGPPGNGGGGNAIRLPSVVNQTMSPEPMHYGVPKWGTSKVFSLNLTRSVGRRDQVSKLKKASGTRSPRSTSFARGILVGQAGFGDCWGSHLLQEIGSSKGSNNWLPCCTHLFSVQAKLHAWSLKHSCES